MATKNNFLDFLIVRILSQVFNRTKVNIIAQMTLIKQVSQVSQVQIKKKYIKEPKLQIKSVFDWNMRNLV